MPEFKYFGKYIVSNLIPWKTEPRPKSRDSLITKVHASTDRERQLDEKQIVLRAHFFLLLGFLSKRNGGREAEGGN